MPAVLASSIAAVAQWGLAVSVALAGVVTVVRRRWVFDAIEGALAIAVALALATLTAWIWPEERPFVVLHILPLARHAADNSFPSDHAIAAALIAAYLWPRSRTASLAAIVAAVCIGVARILAELHWPVDIIGGFAVGLCAALLARVALGAWRRETPV